MNAPLTSLTTGNVLDPCPQLLCEDICSCDGSGCVSQGHFQPMTKSARYPKGGHSWETRDSSDGDFSSRTPSSLVNFL